MMWRRVLGVSAAAALAAFPASALEPKQCLTIAQMNAALQAEGQRTLILGDRRAVRDAPERSTGVKVTNYANALTSNADGSLGYHLEGDLPRAQASTSMCVVAKLTNIHLMDARKPGMKAAGLFGAAFDNELREKEKLGTRPMLMADTLHPGPDGKDRLGLPVVLFYNAAGRSASDYIVPPSARPEAMALLGDVDYSPEALRRLDQAAR